MNPKIDCAVTTEEVLSSLKGAVKDRKALSLVRLGDGEGALMNYDEGPPSIDVTRVVKKQFGPGTLTPDQIAVLASELRAAIAAADFVGLHRSDAHPAMTLPRKVLVERGLWGAGTIFCRSSIHRDLQCSGGLTELLTGLPFVGLIAGRRVARGVQHRFGIGRVDEYQVPPEARFADAAIAEHFPGRFKELRREICVPVPGAVFLVGAGPCGKIYCQWIKERGGIAIDLGSVFDGWSGSVTRSYLSDCGTLDGRLLPEYRL